jgi:hypothetical protein
VRDGIVNDRTGAWRVGGIRGAATTYQGREIEHSGAGSMMLVWWRNNCKIGKSARRLEITNR